MTTVNLSNRDTSMDKTSEYFDRTPFLDLLNASAGTVTSSTVAIEDFRNFTFFLVCANNGSSTTSGTVYIDAQLKADGPWIVADTTTLAGVDVIKQVSGPFYGFRVRAVTVADGTVAVSMRAQR